MKAYEDGDRSFANALDQPPVGASLQDVLGRNAVVHSSSVKSVGAAMVERLKKIDHSNGVRGPGDVPMVQVLDSPRRPGVDRSLHDHGRIKMAIQPCQGSGVGDRESQCSPLGAPRCSKR